MAVDTRTGEIDLTDRRAAAAGVEAPDEEPMRVGQLYWLGKALVAPVLRFCWRIRTEGLENVPKEGPAIIAANHQAAIDSFFVPSVLPRRITYVGKAEYLDDWKTRKLFPALGMIPIDRSGGSASERALNTAARALERGELFGIYPEGTRSRSGKLHKGHTGAARLALRCNAPIVPVGIIGTREIQPPESPVPKFFRTVILRFGTPIDVEKYLDRADDRLVLRQITDEVMFEIRNLTGLDYDPTYATKPTAQAASSEPEAAVEEPTIPRRSSAELLGAHAKAG